MARGQKTDTEVVYSIMSLYFTYGNYSKVARMLDMPESTVEKIVKENYDKKEFVKLCEEKQQEFSVKATKIIDKALNRIDRELEMQDTIPVNQLSTVVGTLFDKVRLDRGESTSNENQTIKIAFNEDIEELSK